MLPIYHFVTSPVSGWTGHDRPPKRFAATVGVAVGLGMAVGILATWFPPFWVLVALAALPFGILALKRSEFALLGILLATSSIVYEELLPVISTPIGSLHITDVLLLALLGLIIIRRMLKPELNIIRTPLDWPLLAFYGVTLLSTFVAIHGSSVEVEMARRAIRVVTYYLTFFIVTNLVREDHQLHFLVRGMLILATVVAAAMVAQFLLGESLHLFPGRVESLQTQGVSYVDITRILPPGQSIVVVAFITITVILVLGGRRPLNILVFLQWGLLGLAVLLSFTRTFWVQAGLAILFLTFLVSGRGMVKLMTRSLVVLLFAAPLLLFVFDNRDSRFAGLITASYERLATLGSSKTVGEDSLQWRYVENEYVLPQILSHPLLGLGLGARYRPFDWRIDRIDYHARGWDPRRYIHNAHFWIIMMAGPLAYLCLVWLSVVFLLRGFKYWRLIPDLRMRGYVLSFSLIYLGVLLGAIVSPMFMQWYWTPVIGILMGVNEGVIGKAIRASKGKEGKV